jgi:hypothetical protein
MLNSIEKKKRKPSTVSKGSYYKNKTREWYQKKGYTVELTEFVCGRMIAPGKIIYTKKDILASDGIAYNENEFILWNSKHTTTGSIANEKSSGKKDYEKIKVPKFIKKQLIIWQPRIKEPTIIEV